MLGYVACWQTKRANEQSDYANEISNRLLSIEESRDKLELSPFIMVTDFKAYAKIKCELINDPDQLYILRDAAVDSYARRFLILHSHNPPYIQNQFQRRRASNISQDGHPDR